MPLAWNEIRHRAIKFANEWARTQSEAADKQTFWNEFFEVFGVARKTVSSFEVPVRKVNTGHDGYIDLLWKGVLIVEHKSAGGNLGKAQSQVFQEVMLDYTAEKNIMRVVRVKSETNGQITFRASGFTIG